MKKLYIFCILLIYSGVVNAQTELKLGLPVGHTPKEGVNAIVFSPSTAEDSVGGKYIVSVSDDKTARVWDGETGKLLHSLKGHEKAINQVAFSPDANRIITSSQDGAARIWLLRRVIAPTGS